MNITKPILVVKTACGYPAGPIEDSKGNRYMCHKTGQITRQGPPKMNKAERKQHKKERHNAHT